MVKRKRTAVAASQSTGPRGVDQNDGRIRGITSWADALSADGVTGEDAFAAQRDRIDLQVDGQEVVVPGRKASRRAQREADDEELGLGDEVLALDLPEQQDDEEMDEVTEGVTKKRKKVARAGDDAPIPSKLSRHQRPDPTAQDRLSDSDDDNDEDDEAEERQTWNPRAYHVTANEDPEPESDDEEGVEMQLAEVQRIQQERRAKLRETDFAAFKPRDGFALGAGSNKTIRIDAKRCVRSWAASHARRLLDGDDATASARPSFPTRAHAIAHLLRNEPEVLALVDDFASMADQLAASTERLAASALEDDDDAEDAADEQQLAGKALNRLYHDSLTTYLTLLTFYLHLRISSPVADALQQTVLTRLMQLRTGLAALDEEGISGDAETDGELALAMRPSARAKEEDVQTIDLDQLGDEQLAKIIEELKKARAEGRDEAEVLAQLYSTIDGSEDEEEDEEDSGDSNTIDDEPATAGSADESEEEDEEDEMAIKTSTTLSLPPMPARPRARPINEIDDDLLDPTSLTSAEASEKAAKKHSLRFHTARIDAKARSRATAGTDRRMASGDDDVPYRSRDRSRAAVTRERQAQRNSTGADEDWGMDGLEEMDDGIVGEAEAYFDLVKRNKAEAKAAKIAAHETERSEQRDATAEAIGALADGPRAANRTILANKGLTPKRAKANRNPRVKKRLRYETAKQKVKSQRPVFDADKARKGRTQQYEGETSGINRRTVKSRKL